MKKYIKPFIQLTDIDNEQILAASPGISKDPAKDDACAKEFFVDDWSDDYINTKTDDEGNI